MKFFINSKNESYLRGLEEEFGESTNGIRVELNRFEKAGFLSSFLKGNKKYFKANIDHPFYSEINKIVLKTTGIEYVVDYILQRIGDLKKVYLIGGLSRGLQTDIIDLVLVGGDLNKAFLIEQIEKAEKKLKKKIRFIHYSSKEFNLDTIKQVDMFPLLLWEKDK